METYMRGAAYGRIALQIFAAVCAAWWMLVWFLYGINDGSLWLDTIREKINSKFLGTHNGVTFMLQMVPVVLIAFVGFLSLELKRRIRPTLKTRANGKKASINIWTMPLIVKSPMGMLTLGDVILILAVLFIILWYLIKWSVKFCQEIDAEPPGEEEGEMHVAKYVDKVFYVGYMFGDAAIIPIALLWIPVSRGSPMLNVIGVPFERAVKYHIWVGSLTVWFVFLHGALLTWYYIEIGEANVKGLFSWHPREIAILPGDIACVTGVIMLVTALGWVRRKNYDFFFAVHHLYLVFALFYGFHCAWCIDYMIVPLLLFFLDRFMRMVQSRKQVDVLSAKVTGTGNIELTVSKLPNSRYHALSFLYVRFPSVSRLMWHPFSVASSPLDGTNKIIIYIKPLGGFTRELHDLLLSSKYAEQAKPVLYKCPFSFKVGLEGPYGSDSIFYLRYKCLVMAAGGIGVTPFLAILKDLLHRHRLHYEELPSSVHLVFCVKNFRELHLLDTVAPNSILPGYEEHMKITVTAYVTQEIDAQKTSNTYELTTMPKGETNLKPTEQNETREWDETIPEEDIVLYSSSGNSANRMSQFGSTGDTKWVAATFAAAIIGHFISFGTLNLKYHETRDSGVIRVMLLMVCMFIGVVIFGGSVMLLWAYCKSRKAESKVISRKDQSASSGTDDNTDVEKSPTTVEDQSLWRGNVTFGKRPDWKDVFTELATRYDGEDVGVMVSGIQAMQQDVASQCMKHSLRRSSTVVFHYHSVSFDL